MNRFVPPSSSPSSASAAHNKVVPPLLAAQWQKALLEFSNSKKTSDILTALAKLYSLVIRDASVHVLKLAYIEMDGRLRQLRPVDNPLWNEQCRDRYNIVVSKIASLLPNGPQMLKMPSPQTNSFAATTFQQNLQHRILMNQQAKRNSLVTKKKAPLPKPTFSYPIIPPKLVPMKEEDHKENYMTRHSTIKLPDKKADEFLYIAPATVKKITGKQLPKGTPVINQEVKDMIQECATEFFLFLWSETKDLSKACGEKSVSGKSVVNSLASLGYSDYTGIIDQYNQKLTTFFEKKQQAAATVTAAAARKYVTADHAVASAHGTKRPLEQASVTATTPVSLPAVPVSLPGSVPSIPVSVPSIPVSVPSVPGTVPGSVQKPSVPSVPIPVVVPTAPEVPKVPAVSKVPKVPAVSKVPEVPAVVPPSSTPDATTPEVRKAPELPEEKK